MSIIRYKCIRKLKISNSIESGPEYALNEYNRLMLEIKINPDKDNWKRLIRSSNSSEIPSPPIINVIKYNNDLITYTKEKIYVYDFLSFKLKFIKIIDNIILCDIVEGTLKIYATKNIYSFNSTYNLMSIDANTSIKSSSNTDYQLIGNLIFLFKKYTVMALEINFEFNNIVY